MNSRLVVAALAASLVSTTVFGEPKVMEFRGAGVCNASAAVALDERRIVVGDDEQPWLSTFDVTTRALLGKTTLGFIDVGQEADIEGATILQGQVIWITSHGRDGKGRAQESRQMLFGSEISDGATGVGHTSGPFRNLLAAVTAHGGNDPVYARLRSSIGTKAPDPKLAPKEAGFNIEGLATSEGLVPQPALPSLLVGLRNPVAEKGQAILLEIRNPLALLGDSSAKPDLGQAILLDLGGRRIRDIAYSSRAKAYLIIGGPVGNKAEKFADGRGSFVVFKWNGRADAVPEAIDAFGDLNVLDEFHAEAIVALQAREAGKLVTSDRVLLLSDDGKRSINGKSCEKLPSSEQFFRGIIGRVP